MWQTKLATRNRERLQNSEKAACYYCLETFAADSIEEWTDDDETALCPKCGIDSVVADDGKALPSLEQLREWNEESFGTKVLEPD